jgi:hypothetical protein
VPTSWHCASARLVLSPPLHVDVRYLYEMSSSKRHDLDDYSWITVFEYILAPEGPSQKVRPLLSVCRRWKVRVLRHSRFRTVSE